MKSTRNLIILFLIISTVFIADASSRRSSKRRNLNREINPIPISDVKTSWNNYLNFLKLNSVKDYQEDLKKVSTHLLFKYKQEFLEFVEEANPCKAFFNTSFGNIERYLSDRKMFFPKNSAKVPLKKKICELIKQAIEHMG